MDISILSHARMRRMLLILGIELLILSVSVLLYVSPCIATDSQKLFCTGSHYNYFQESSQHRNMGSVALSDDGKLFTVAVDDRGWSDLFVFDVSTGKPLWNLALPDPASSVALTPNGNALAVSFTMRPPGCPHVELLMAATGKRLVTLEDPPELSSLSESTQTVTFSSDGKLLAASTDSAVRVWEVSTGKSVSAIEPPGFETRKGVDSIQDLAFSPDGKKIAGVSGRWPIIYLWNIKNGRLLCTLKIPGFTGGFGSIVFNADGSLLAAGSTGPTAIWNTRTGKLITTISKPPDGPIGPISFQGRQMLLISGTIKLQLWDVSKRKPSFVHDLTPLGAVMNSVMALNSGKLIGLTASAIWETKPFKSRELQLIDISAGKVISTMQLPGRATGKASINGNL